MNMDDVVIDIQHLRKVFPLYADPSQRLKEALSPTRKVYHTDFLALDDINLQVRKGETIGIIGVNGSGKSTLLKLITGVLTPTKGNIAIHGRISAILELGLGFNMQYTGIENAYLYGDVMGYTREEMAAKLPEILAYADIGEYVHQPVKTYSSGMLARLAFAVAINIDPDILIVDEALAVGDLFFQAKCFHTFREFKKKNVTILLVTHGMESVTKYCDRALVLHAGKQIAVGKPDEMVDVYKKLQVGQYDPEAEEAAEEAPAETYTEGLKGQMALNAKRDEYGDKSAEIVDMGILSKAGLPTNTLYCDEPFEIVMRVRFHRDVSEPIFAYTFMDVQGNEVTGTNTMVDNVATGTFRKGEEITVRFKQSLPLPGFGYLVHLGVTGFSGNEFVVYHRMYNVFAVQVVSPRTNVGVFDPHSEISIERKDGSR